MKRIVAVLALLLLAAAPVNRVEFVFDQRIPAANQQLLEQELVKALESETQNGMRATVTISLRVIEPQPEPGVLVASAR